MNIQNWKTMISSLLMLLAVLAGGIADGRDFFADYVYLPPDKGDPAWMYWPLPAAELQAMLADAPPPRMVRPDLYDKSSAAADAVPEMEKDVLPARIGRSWTAGWDAADLAVKISLKSDTGASRWIMAVGAEGSGAIRIHADLNGLGPHDQVFLAAPDGQRVFGPWTRQDARPEGNWLNTIWGEYALLILESPDGLPPVRVEQVASLYPQRLKAFNVCPIPLDCDPDPVILELATAEAMLLIPLPGGEWAQCSGTLLNRAGTPDFAPRLISAHHCFDISGINYNNVEVVWDYRTGVCDLNTDPPEPNLLPRSRAKESVAYDKRIDGHFLLLDSVPNGPYGRAWAGWDTRALQVGQTVRGFHYPAGSPIKTGVATIIDTDVSLCLDLLCTNRYVRQDKVRWNEGITEGGSSGSGLFLVDAGLRLVGMLSNGNDHVCGRPDLNLDNYASFRDFFPRIACHLTDDQPCEKLRSWCFIARWFGKDSATTETLQEFRDQVLGASALGQTLSRAYYRASAWLL